MLLNSSLVTVLGLDFTSGVLEGLPQEGGEDLD